MQRLDTGQAQQDLTLRITRADGKTEDVPVRCRIDTPIEIDYYQHGGILPFVLRRVGVAPGWVVNLTLVVWYVGLAALAATLWQLRKVLKRLAQGTSLAS